MPPLSRRSLPLAPSPLAPSRRPEIGIPGAARVLIVDDEAPVRRVLARFLRERGYDVHECDAVQAALALLQQEHFVVLLCEVRMPGMSGLELVPRALELDSTLAVVMLTTVNEFTAATEALTRGALDCLVKPIPLPDLERALERTIHRRQLEIGRRTSSATSATSSTGAPRLRARAQPRS
jgi:DNA-binding NtrC family response regulator